MLNVTGHRSAINSATGVPLFHLGLGGTFPHSHKMIDRVSWRQVDHGKHQNSRKGQGRYELQ
jgi:hypothetical protein